MMQQSEKLKVLYSLKEDEFRKDVIIPILKRMGFKQVRERHGTQEYGKDITYRSENPLGESYGAVVAKVGPITGGATGKQNLDAVISQVGMAFSIPVEDVEQQRTYPIQEVIVWTSGSIASNAEKRIRSQEKEFRNIRFFDGQKTVELLEKYYPAFFTIRDPYVAEYYSAAKKFHARLEELRTLGNSSDQRHLPSIFVPPTLVEFDGKRKKNPRLNGETSRHEFTFEQIIESNDDILILGELGAGKSTLLRRILLSVITKNEQTLQKTPLPILVPFKKIDVDATDCIEQATSKEFSRFANSHESEAPPLDFTDGSVILLLDSVDELKSSELMIQALERVNQFKSKHKRTRIILTSRFIEGIHRMNVLAGFRTLEIRNLSPNQMIKFVQKWYANDNRFAAKLVQLIQSPLALQGLPSTPLTLALIATIYEHDNKEIPANLTDLFSRYIELTLGRWDTSKEVSLQFEWKIKEFLLRKVGWHMHELETLVLDKEDLHELLDKIGEQRGLSLDAPLFCDEVVSRSELLILNEDGEYEFKHRSFKDFFAGKELDDRSDAVELTIKHANNFWWTQTIFFASSMRPSNHAYIDAIRQKTSVKGLAHLLRGYQIGHLLQGAYLAPRDIKKHTVYYALEEITSAWNAFCELVKRGTKTKDDIVIHFTHTDLVMIFGVLAQISLGSVTLSPILTDISNELLSLDANSTADDKTKQEWQLYLIACACLRSGNTSDFIRIFNSPSLSEPSFLLGASLAAKNIISESWISIDDQKQLETLLERWRRRWENLTEYRQSLSNTLPIPLPSSSSIDDDGDNLTAMK